MAKTLLKPMEFGQRLTTERKRQRFSMSKLAEEIGVEPSTVSRWEKGLVLPQWEHFEKLCSVLGKDYDFFFVEESPLKETEAQKAIDGLQVALDGIRSKIAPENKSNNGSKLDPHFELLMHYMSEVARLTAIADTITSGNPIKKEMLTVIAQLNEGEVAKILPAFLDALKDQQYLGLNELRARKEASKS